MGPATDKHQAPTHRLKLYSKAIIESEALPTIVKKINPRIMKIKLFGYSEKISIVSITGKLIPYLFAVENISFIDV